MKEKKHEAIIPLRNVEFFEYEPIEEILSIHFPSQNILELVNVNNEEFNQFKEAMINEASLFTFGSEHIDFSDVKPLDVKDDFNVNKNPEMADNKIVKVESTVEEGNNIQDLGSWVIASPSKDNRMFATWLDGVWVETCDKNEAMHFNSYKRALDIVSIVDHYAGWKVIPAEILKLEEE